MKEYSFFFHERAKRKDSFGQMVLKYLVHRLERLEISYKITYLYRNQSCTIDKSWYPVLWETSHLINSLVENKRYCLLINERPKPGTAATFVDSISLDDFSGGVTAGEIFRNMQSIKKPVVISGPESDLRSIARVQGFLSQFPQAFVLSAGSWDFEDGYNTYCKLATFKPDALFCCNDRLASAAVSCIYEAGYLRIPIIGFDDAPVSLQCNISTISIPWDELARIGSEVLKKRIGNDTSSTINYILITRPIIRGDNVNYNPVQNSRLR